MMIIFILMVVPFQNCIDIHIPLLFQTTFFVILICWIYGTTCHAVRGLLTCKLHTSLYNTTSHNILRILWWLRCDRATQIQVTHPVPCGFQNPNWDVLASWTIFSVHRDTFKPWLFWSKWDVWSFCTSLKKLRCKYDQAIIKSLSNLVKELEFRRAETVAFLDARIAFQERPGSNATRDTLQRHHRTVACQELRIRQAAHKMRVNAWTISACIYRKVRKPVFFN